MCITMSHKILIHLQTGLGLLLFVYFTIDIYLFFPSKGKASSMVAVALCPQPGWEVLDACAAPGNKTVHLAALMKGMGNIIACELHKERARLLEDTIRRTGAPNVNIFQGDFLDLDARDPKFSKIRAILLDPSCSGSGIARERLDYLLPSFKKGEDGDAANSQRVRNLAAFQTKALLHALSFPAVERVVYSTCSIHQAENEDVISSVLPFATSIGFELATPFPQWPHRGLPVFNGAEHLLRTDPTEETEGFFIALFARKSETNKSEEAPEESHIQKLPHPSTKKICRMRKPTPFLPLRKMLQYNAIPLLRHNRKRKRI
ncbi:probable 28S rRNA (cytosine-C(5))-methyltransferase [Asparagus officinalis]|uniref:probable 28S rRNA (cytosine-C(5))-methyltransferase n=1 Tax=Asparagus officinalis TaxID=4686 RepID=UPI00098E1BC0|nr:probable 28S rRNA (cytosine-C(5))-methyltransferase [Asparagus officinalis]